MALATVVDGPSAGRQALIWLDKPPIGALGLGDLEPQVITDAKAVLAGRQHRRLRYPPSNLQPPTSNLQPPTSSLQPPTSNLHHPVSVSVFVEVQRRTPELLIVGGGHIA